LISRRYRIKKAMRSDLVDPAFRERKMLMVTEVNQCRYCPAFHVQQAYKVGLSDGEVLSFVQGTFLKPYLNIKDWLYNTPGCGLREMARPKQDLMINYSKLLVKMVMMPSRQSCG